MLHNYDKYDPIEMLSCNSTVLVVGQRGSGKSTMLQYLLHSLVGKLNMVHVFCPTRDTRREYEMYFPGCNVYESFDVKKLERICEEQKHLSAASGEGSRAPRVGIVLDDCVWNKSDINSTIFRYLLMNGRHDNISLFLGSQYILDFPKDLRSQVDLLVAFPEANFEYREPLRKNFLGSVCHSDESLQARTVCLGSQEALVFDCKAHREHRPHWFMCIARDIGAIAPPRAAAADAPHLPAELTFVETCVKEKRAIVTFDSPVPIVLYNANEDDGSVTFFAKEDVFATFMRRGRADILLRQHVSDEFKSFTGLRYAYKTVSGTTTLTWASNNMLSQISVIVPSA